MSKSTDLIKNEGVIVASTHHLEWALPWWWYNYSAHNDRPVVFFDLGMSEKGRAFCREKGSLVTPKIPSLDCSKEKTPKELGSKWEKLIGSGVWDIRHKWLQKPFVFASTPFERTLWLDLDCEVRTSLSPIFSMLDKDVELVIGEEPPPLQQGLLTLGLTLPGEVTYNSGVVAYHKNATFLHKWQEETLLQGHIHIGDQEALSRVLFETPFPHKKLPVEYNWDRGLGSNPAAAIFHWHGQPGKQQIKEQIQALALIGLIDLTL